jgi:hypothetical protein
MPGFATLRLSWEPRMLSILRIMVGLLFLEHSLAKVLDFPHPLACRRWRMGPRSATCARLRIRPVAEPGLSIIGQRRSTERSGPLSPAIGHRND